LINLNTWAIAKRPKKTLATRNPVFSGFMAQFL
jgi:hypothetical protein